jgi:peptidoglycan/LPS O-acetylase OafA/YrhL
MTPPTELRMRGWTPCFLEALLGYFYHFCPHSLGNLLQSTRNRLAIALCSASLLSTVFFFPREDRFFATFGYSCLYLGFGGVLLLSLYLQGILRSWVARSVEVIGSAAAFVGTYSYSIYLWHGTHECMVSGFRS